MGCPCSGNNKPLSLFGGGGRRRKRRSKTTRRKGRSRKGSRRSNRRKTRSVMKGGMNVTLLGDQTTNPLNYLNQVLGSPGAPSMPWTQPANTNYGIGNRYVV